MGGIGPREISIAILPAGAQLREQIKALPSVPGGTSAAASQDDGGAHGEYD
jgi:hypothetical protein